MNTPQGIAIEVVYATPAKQYVVRFNVQRGTTARQAVDAAGLNSEFPDLDISRLRLGIYGEMVADDYVLQPADRVEIYRPLINEPREKRRQRVARARKTSAVNSKTRIPRP